jgi:hypothetical protein
MSQALDAGSPVPVGRCAAEDERQASSAAAKVYSSIDALAGACLEPAALSSGGARACADLAWRLLPLLRRGGLGRNYDEQFESTVEWRLLAIAGSLGDVDLAKAVLRVMAGISDGGASRRGFAVVVASEGVSGALAEVQSNLDFKDYPVITMGPQKKGNGARASSGGEGSLRFSVRGGASRLDSVIQVGAI